MVRQSRIEQSGGLFKVPNAQFARIGPGIQEVRLIGTTAPEPRGGEQAKRPPRGGGSGAAKPVGFGMVGKLEQAACFRRCILRGGTPFHLNQFPNTISFKDHIINLIQGISGRAFQYIEANQTFSCSG